ncbi:MAG TPA: pectate lyase [Verrucomicrobiota bacterium]|nr:pectate lyase [Verrucomicrobiota bacterium]
MKQIRVVLIIYTLSLSFCSYASNYVGKYLKYPDKWFKTEQAGQVAKNILSYQSPYGGFPKNIDTTAKPYTDNPQKLQPTFDNSATVDELRFLARYYTATKDETAKNGFLKGYDYIIKAQYPNGGFPQSYPPGNGYPRFITFNDNAMVRLLIFLLETTQSQYYDFLDNERKAKAKTAFDRGIDCILKCQIKVNGKLTVWCAQHDEKTFEPQGARKFELPSLSGAESADIVLLLMSIENPSQELIDAVKSAVEWFESSKIKGIRIIEKEDAKNGKDKVVVNDPTAPPIWARFYEIGTNKPIFADRDGVKKYSLSEIGYERRNGYAWYGYWPQKPLTEYPRWEKRVNKN